MQQIHAMEKLQSLNPAVYRKILNYCDNAPSYRTAYATAGTYSNHVIDTLSRHTDELDDLSKVSSSLTREVVEEVTKAGSRSADNLGDIAREALENARKRADEIIASNYWIRNLDNTNDLNVDDFLLLKDNGVVKVNISGSNRPLTGAPNSYYKTGNGEHIFVYDENGKLIYDISSSRVKSFIINVDPNGVEHYQAYKLEGAVPDAIKEFFGW